MTNLSRTYHIIVTTGVEGLSVARWREDPDADIKEKLIYLNKEQKAQLSRITINLFDCGNKRQKPDLTKPEERETCRMK